MQQAGRDVRERYVLTIDQVISALTDTVLRAQVQSAEDPARGGVLGTILRVDRAFEGMDRWFLRLILTGIPLALGVFLLVMGSVMYGVLAIVASPLVLLLVLGVERVVVRLDRAVDSATDPAIVRSGARRLKSAIDRGDVEVMSGPVDAELSGDELRVRAGHLSMTIPSIRTAWRAHSSAHIVLAASAPGLRPDFAKCVLLPADGEIAAAIAGESEKAPPTP